MPTDKLNILFAGSGEYAVRPLMALHKLLSTHPNWRLAGLITNPPRPAGRGRELTPPPVLAHFQQQSYWRDVPVFTPEKIGDESESILEQTTPDLILVNDYGGWIPESMLAYPKHRCLNLHPSLLPRHRGAIPIQAALLAGDETTGVTLQVMAKKMDAGPIVAQRETTIEPHETAAELSERLSSLGALLLEKSLPDWVQGKIKALPQDESQASYAYERDLDKSEAELNWTEPAEQLARRIRAYNPKPTAWTTLEGSRLKLLKAQVAKPNQAPREAQPGTLHVLDKQLFVRTGQGWLRLDQIQPAGKQAMSARDFLNGFRPSGVMQLTRTPQTAADDPPTPSADSA